MKGIIALSLLLISSLASASTQQQKNKEVVRNFYELAFNQHKPAEAMKLYVGNKYIQHNPFAGDGKQAFITFFEEYFKKNKETSISIKRLIAEDDLVVIHVHSKGNKTERGRAVMDIFRLEDGKIVEHWDVVQVIPEKSANTNTMF